MESFEHDPTDGKVGFIEIQVPFFAIESLHDVFILFQGMHEAGRLASEDAGHIIYPFLAISALEDYSNDT